jgi:pimeloyl-ACP methyl ester carboxylesterase
MIDSAPGVLQSGSGRDSATTTITTIASLPEKFSSRAEFTDALLAKGLNRASAQWLAQSTEQAGDQWRFALDLDEMRALILDYMALDLWSVVENPSGRLRVHLVIGDRSSSYSPADRSRAAAIQAANHRVTVDVLPAGHWVHVDDPDGLLRVLQDRIRD